MIFRKIRPEEFDGSEGSNGHKKKATDSKDRNKSEDKNAPPSDLQSFQEKVTNPEDREEMGTEDGQPEDILRNDPVNYGNMNFNTDQRQGQTAAGPNVWFFFGLIFFGRE